MNYQQQLAALSSVDSPLAEQVHKLQNLEAILKWAPNSGIPLSGIDLVQQDEYSYDLFLPLPDSRWLVLGVS